MNIRLHEQLVNRSDTFKYLRVVLDETLSFKDHIHHVRKKVSKVLGMFSRVRPSLTIEATNRLYIKLW